MRLDHLPPVVAQCLRSYYSRKRSRQMVRALCSTLIFLLLLALVSMHADRFFFLSPRARTGLTAGTLGLTALWALFQVVHLIRTRMTPRQIAYELESQVPGNAEERFVSLENILARRDYAGKPIAEDLVAQLEKSAVQYGLAIQPAALAREPRLGRHGFFLLFTTLAYAALYIPPAYQFSLMVKRFVLPMKELPKPSFIKLKVEPREVVVGKGGEVLIQAEVSGKIPIPLRWMLERLGYSSSRCVIAMREGNVRTFDFDSAGRARMVRLLRNTHIYARTGVESSFSFRIRCGDAETLVCFVEVVAQPRVKRVKLTAVPPAYTRLPTTTIDDVRTPVRFLPGTKITLGFTTDQPVTERQILLDGEKYPVNVQWDASKQSGLYTFELTRKTGLEIRVRNARGFYNVERRRIEIGLKEDLAPTIQLKQPAQDTSMTPGGLVPFQAILQDDIGISEAAISFVLNPAADVESAAQELPIPLPHKDARNLSLSFTFDLGKTKAVPGDVIALHLRARDAAGNDGTSRAILVHVVPFTRGENERKRILALSYTARVLNELALLMEKQPGPQDPMGLTIPKARAEDLAQNLLREGVIPRPVHTISKLLQLLEREHHFTDSPRDKATLRLLYLAVLDACGPRFPMTLDRNLTGIARLRKIAQDTIPALARFRQAKNLLRRIFGMRYEALAIRRNIQQLSNTRKMTPEQARSLKRRAKVYLDALQDIGEEVILLAASCPELPQKQLTELVMDLNTAGVFLVRKSANLRINSCGQIADLLLKMLELLRSALPSLHAKAATRQAELERGHSNLLRQMADHLDSIGASEEHSRRRGPCWELMRG